MTTRLCLVAASLFLSGTLIAIAAEPDGPKFKAGVWEITRQMKGGPRKDGPQTDRYCFTEAQLTADPAAPLRTEPRPGGTRSGPSCVIGPATMNKGKAALTTTCQGPMGAMKATIAGTYTAASFSMSGKMKMGFMSAKMSMTGRYLGACTTR